MCRPHRRRCAHAPPLMFCSLPHPHLHSLAPATPLPYPVPSKKLTSNTVPDGLGVGNAPLGVKGLPTSKPRGNSRGNWTAAEVG